MSEDRDMIHLYTLDQHGNPVREHSWERWMDWFRENSVVVRMENSVVVRMETVGESTISTVFLGVSSSPKVWETMVFGGSMDSHQERCSGPREQAEAMHADVVKKVKAKHETYRP